jgi:hypothetical protein
MKTLTKIFSVNRIANSIVEIAKSINGYTEYTLVQKDSLIINNGIIKITEKVFNAKKDFFTKIHSI